MLKLSLAMPPVRSKIRAERLARLRPLLSQYGALLTDKQREFAQQHVVEGLSLSEIGRRHNVSRQAVHDTMRHVQRILEDYESKLNLASSGTAEAPRTADCGEDKVKAKLEELKGKLSRQRIIYSVDWILHDLNEALELLKETPKPKDD